MAVNEQGLAVYVSFMNTHNGYYSHGFSMTQSGRTIYDGSL